jgi:hypothetical protein
MATDAFRMKRTSKLLEIPQIGKTFSKPVTIGRPSSKIRQCGQKERLCSYLSKRSKSLSSGWKPLNEHQQFRVLNRPKPLTSHFSEPATDRFDSFQQHSRAQTGERKAQTCANDVSTAVVRSGYFLTAKAPFIREVRRAGQALSEHTETGIHGPYRKLGR